MKSSVRFFCLMFSVILAGRASFADGNQCIEAVHLFDYSKAFMQCSTAAAAGDPGAQAELGLLYENGLGVERDFALAAKWYLASAEQGMAWSQHALAALYFDGNGVLRDAAVARYWYEEAASQGFVRAQSELGWMYLNGLGIPKDNRKAGKWIKAAALQGGPWAQNVLGTMYANGTGVAQDYVLAYMWTNIASANGSYEAPKIRDEIFTILSKEDVALAQAMARKCLSSEYTNCEP